MRLSSTKLIKVKTLSTSSFSISHLVSNTFPRSLLRYAKSVKRTCEAS
jgi:hypothetical protein